ncbi:MAG TPA: M24 family metallopeptidase [Bacteriovoracaceae bacterium]|nr:M24 family metallopeptidase [Bacteriovoracaceae bacterium]
MGIQDFGPNFQMEKFYKARDLSRDLTFELSTLIKPGMDEEEAHGLYRELSRKYRAQKQWHPPKIRFGPNTLKNFSEVSDPYLLKDEDLYFIDIGPVFDGHEADFGETFTLGQSFDHMNIAVTAKKVYAEVKEFWKQRKCTGKELYDFALAKAKSYGYHLNLGNDGHRLADFPHALIHKGGLGVCEETVVPDAWILEIHLWNSTRTFGAFFEDLLTDKEI